MLKTIGGSRCGHVSKALNRISQPTFIHTPPFHRQEDTSDWLLTDKVSSWPGSPADRGWRYLRQSLERHDGPETDYRYFKVTLETILSMQRSTPPPPWLIRTLEVRFPGVPTVFFMIIHKENHPEYLIRTSLRYENFDQAIGYTLSLIRRVR